MGRKLWCVAIAVALGYCGIAHAEVWPSSNWSEASPAERQMDAARVQDAANYALTGGGSGMIVRPGDPVRPEVIHEVDRRNCPRSCCD